MNDIYWIKFHEQDGHVECICLPGRKKCPPETKPSCKEYVAKFTEIKRTTNVQHKPASLITAKIERSVAELERVLKRKGVRI